MKRINKYIFFARYLPGLISILPITLTYFFLTKKYSSYELKEYLESFTFIMGISLSFLLTFFASMVVRELGSSLEKRYFKNRLELPTNTLLLYEDDRLPKKAKDAYGQKIKNDFNLVRYSEAKEKGNRTDALKILHQASRFICARYQQHSQVKDATITYGFVRNLSGGLIISLPVSVLGIVAGWYFKDNSLLLWSCISTIAFGLVLLFHKMWIKENAEKFAYKVITIYLADVSFNN